MADHNIHPRILLRIVIVCAAVAAGATLIMTDDRFLKIVGAVIVIAVLLLWFGSDIIDAWSNERHVARHPHLLKNEAIGQSVAAVGDFQAAAGSAKGYVTLNGEKWRAISSGAHVPKGGERLRVRQREGLILHVQPQGVEE